MSDKFKHKAGLRNVGSYQVAGTPYVTASTNLADGSEKKIEFPTVTKSITVRKDDQANTTTQAAPPFALRFTDNSDNAIRMTNNLFASDGNSFSISYWQKWNVSDPREPGTSTSAKKLIWGIDHNTAAANPEAGHVWRLLHNKSTNDDVTNGAHFQLLCRTQENAAPAIDFETSGDHTTWRHWAFTFDSTNGVNTIAKVYCDGAQQGSDLDCVTLMGKSGGGSRSNSKFILGTLVGSTKCPEVSTSELAIWSGVLSPADITSLINTGTNQTFTEIPPTLPLGVRVREASGGGGQGGLYANTSTTGLFSGDDESFSISWRGKALGAWNNQTFYAVSVGLGTTAHQIFHKSITAKFQHQGSGKNVVFQMVNDVSPYIKTSSGQTFITYTETDWNTYVIVVDTANEIMRLYINGTEVANSGTSFAGLTFGTSAAKYITIGDVLRADSTNQNWSAAMVYSDVVVWNKALSASDVTTIYNSNANFDYTTTFPGYPTSLGAPSDPQWDGNSAHLADSGSAYVNAGGAGSAGNPFTWASGGKGLMINNLASFADNNVFYFRGKAGWHNGSSTLSGNTDYKIRVRTGATKPDSTGTDLAQFKISTSDTITQNAQNFVDAINGGFAEDGRVHSPAGGVPGITARLSPTVEGGIDLFPSNENMSNLDKIVYKGHTPYTNWYARPEMNLGSGGGRWHKAAFEETVEIIPQKLAYYRFNPTTPAPTSNPGDGNKIDSIGAGGVIYNRSQDYRKVAGANINVTNENDDINDIPTFAAGEGGDLGYKLEKYLYCTFDANSSQNLYPGSGAGTGTTSGTSTDVLVKNKSTDSLSLGTGGDLEIVGDAQYTIGKSNSSTEGTPYSGGGAGGDVRVHFASKSNANVTNNKHFWKLTDQYEQITMDVKTKEIYVSADGDAVDFTIQAELTSIPTGSVASHEGSGVDS